MNRARRTTLHAEYRLVAGVDEAGRGPLAGPVVVAAVILDRSRPIRGLDDSKLLSEERRNVLARRIRERAVAWRVESVDVDIIDHINILQATLLGMSRAVLALDPAPELALIDGDHMPQLHCRGSAIIGGDGLEPAISAASILAKVHRDSIMRAMHRSFPQYGFDRHKGYATPEHLANLVKYGPCPHHRRTFAPVREAINRHPGSVDA